MRFALRVVVEAGKIGEHGLTERRGGATSLYLAAITKTEFGRGLAATSVNKPADDLSAGLDRMPGTGFTNRILPFDSHAARACDAIVVGRCSMSAPILRADCQIAALSLCRRMAVATRDVHHSTV